MVLERQVTKDIDIINLCTLDNLDLRFWKKQNIKEFNRSLELEKKNVIGSILEIPRYAAFVKSYEKVFNKKQSEFNHLEKDQIERAYHERVGEIYK